MAVNMPRSQESRRRGGRSRRKSPGKAFERPAEQKVADVLAAIDDEIEQAVENARAHYRSARDRRLAAEQTQASADLSNENSGESVL